MWQDVGFDAAAFQPNYYFEQLNVDRMEDASNTAKSYGMGVEMEFDDRMLTDKVFRDRFYDYLKGGGKRRSGNPQFVRLALPIHQGDVFELMPSLTVFH